jgi:hypothetical protein
MNDECKSGVSREEYGTSSRPHSRMYFGHAETKPGEASHFGHE